MLALLITTGISLCSSLKQWNLEAHSHTSTPTLTVMIYYGLTHANPPDLKDENFIPNVMGFQDGVLGGN